MLDEAAAAPPTFSPKEDFYFRYHVIRSRAVVLALAGRAAEAEAELARLPAVPGRPRGEGEGGALEKGLLGPRAAIAGARGDLEGAVRTLRELLSDEKESDAGSFPYYPGTFRVRVRLADALVALGRPDEAREELRPVLAVNPRFAPALAVIARIEGRAADAKGSAGR